jgi:hypothetical protein
MSCCAEADAYWADSFEVDGDRYVAIITDERPDGPLGRPHRESGEKIVVPNHKIKWDDGNPTGHGIIYTARILNGAKPAELRARLTFDAPLPLRGDHLPSFARTRPRIIAPGGEAAAIKRNRVEREISPVWDPTCRKR